MAVLGNGPTRRLAEMRQRARSCGLLIGIVAAVVVPAWSGFDLILEPRQAPLFIVVRCVCDIPILAMLWVLASRPFGREHPELLTVAMFAVVQAEIAWMVVRATEHRDAYVMGFSLSLYASGCIMGGRLRWTGAVIVTTWVAFIAALVTSSRPFPATDLAGTSFYLSTASIVALIAHGQRLRLSDREMSARERLEHEQRHTRELLDQLRRLSNEDSLTGVANRRCWDTELQQACDRSQATGLPLAVLLIDIDRFKDVNDRNGHSGGDETLRIVASFLAEQVGSRGLVARIGGDEFGVLLYGTEAVRAAKLGETMRREAQQLRPCGGALTVSVGVAAATGQEARADRLIGRADAQLYRAKATRNALAV